MSKFYVSESAFKVWDFRKEHACKPYVSNAKSGINNGSYFNEENKPLRFCGSKWILAKHFLVGTGGTKITVFELRNKTRGIYGYRFHCAIRIVKNDGATWYISKNDGYREQAFINACHYAGLQLYSSFTSNELVRCSAVTSADGSTLPCLFKALCPDEELDLELSESIHALNH